MDYSPPPLLARLAVALLVLIALCMGTWTGSLENGTDAIYAVVARDVAAGNWLVPEVAGGPYLMKPPLYFWACAISLKVFGGASEVFALRLPAILSGWLSVLLVAGLAGRLARDARGWIAGAIVAMLSPTFFEFARRVFMEETLALTMLAVLYCALRAKDEHDPRWLWGVGLGTAAAILTKSYGGGFAGFAVLCWLAAVGPRRWLRSLPFLGGIAAGGALIVIWVLVMLQAAPEEFVRQNLAPFGLGSSAQFSWYQTESFFYFRSPLDPDRLVPGAVGLDRWAPVLGSALVFAGGWIALLFASIQGRKDPARRGFWLLLIYMAVGVAVWSSLTQQRLYYLVPFFPVLAAACAAVLVGLLPKGTPTTAVLAVLAGSIFLVQQPAFEQRLLDPEPGAAELGDRFADRLPEGAVVYRYNDFFAATELYMERRAVGLTPNPELLVDFGRILVLGERDIARDGRPGALYGLYREHLARGEPFVLLTDQEGLTRLMPGLPGLHPWFAVPDWPTGRLWLASSVPPTADGSLSWGGRMPQLHEMGYVVASDWLVEQGQRGEAIQLLLDGLDEHPDKQDLYLPRLAALGWSPATPPTEAPIEPAPEAGP
jgi:hypothetical protein